MFIQRRQLICLASAGVASCAAIDWLCSDARQSVDSDARQGLDDAARIPRSGEHSYRRTSWALGSDVSMTALHADRAVAQAAVDDAFAELDLVESLMSIYRPESELSRLNRAGVVDRPHPYFVDVLQAARQMSLRSGGAFDVTVQPLWALCAAARQEGRQPSDVEIAAARAEVDWRRVEISPRQIRLHGRGTAITLNGIAQGFAADKATAALRNRGVEHALIDTGELSALGNKQDGQPWKIGIQHPRDPGAYLSLAKLAGRCLATSGDYATTFSADFRLNHLFDPRTGHSPEELSAVSVAAPTAMLADALSTAVFVLGADRGLKLIESSVGADALLVTKAGRTLATRGFPLDV